MRETIYKIFDASDDSYTEWYATDEGIERYLDEQKEHINNYDEELSWTENLRSYGLTYKRIKVER